MSIEWFDRVSAELQDYLESICDKYDQVGHMSIDKGAKHPRIEFYVETDEDDREYFCVLFFDPHNEEFYVESYDIDLDQASRTILEDIEDIIDAVHENFHEFMDEDDLDYEDDFGYIEEYVGEEDFLEEVDVEWETPEITAYIDKEEEVEVTYKFGVIPESGDGILQRINRVQTAKDELLEDEFNFVFSKEEAGTIIALIASHLDSLESLDNTF